MGTSQGALTRNAYLVFLGVVALTGGTSRYDAPSQALVRLAALVLVAVVGWHRSEQPSSRFRLGFLFLGAVGALILIQLVPLPPALWASLPGRERYLEAATSAGELQPWRPINLTPDRGWNAFFALLPPYAALFAFNGLRVSDQRSVTATWLLIILSSAILGLAQVSAGDNETLRFYAAPPSDAPVGLFANRNHQALLMVCGLPILAVWAASMRFHPSAWRLPYPLMVITAAFLLFMISATGSRSGFILCALVIPFTVALGYPTMRPWLKRRSPRRRVLIAVGAVLTLIALIFGALTFSRAQGLQRLLGLNPANDPRVNLVEPVIGMIRAFFPIGSGFGSFDPVFRGFEPFDLLAVTFMNQAHDDYLQIVLEAGLPGLFLILLFVGWWCKRLFKLWLHADHEVVLLGRLGSVMLLLILLASVADYPVRTPLIMILALQSAAWMLMPASETGTLVLGPQIRPSSQ